MALLSTERRNPEVASLALEVQGKSVRLTVALASLLETCSLTRQSGLAPLLFLALAL